MKKKRIIWLSVILVLTAIFTIPHFQDSVVEALIIRFAAAANALLDASNHSDTSAYTVTRGAIITGQGASPTWNGLALGTTGKILISDGTDLAYQAISGDATLASTGALTIAANAVALTTDTSGNYVEDVTAGSGLAKTSSAGEGQTVDLSVDLTEINSTTFGSGTFTTMTFDAGVTDPVWTYGSGTANLSTGTLQAGGNAVIHAGSSWTGGDLGGTGLAATVTDDSHNHTTTTLAEFGTMTATSGNILVADGVDFESVAMSGDVTIATGGATTIGADKVALTTDTTGNYAAGDAEAGAALTGDTATAFFSLGTIEHERGGLEADVSAYSGLVKISGGTTSSITDSSTNWDTAYTHSQDNTQAHSDYLLNGASDIMTGTLTADGLTLGNNENITLGVETIYFDAVTSNDIEFSDDGNFSDTDPHIRRIPTVGDAFEDYAFGNEWYFTNYTDGVVLWRVYNDNTITSRLRQSKSFVITGATTASDYPLWQVPRAITITSVSALCVGGTNWIGHLTEQDSNGLNDAGVDGATDITASAGVSASDDGSLSNPSIDASDYLGIRTTSVSGTNTSITITFNFYEN